MPRVGARVDAASVALVALAAEAAPAVRRLPTAQAALAFCRPAAPPSVAHAALVVRRAPHPRVPIRLTTLARVCVQDDGWTALMIASIYGHEGCVRLLIASGATVNATEVSLERPLPSTFHGSASME